MALLLRWGLEGRVVHSELRVIPNQFVIDLMREVIGGLEHSHFGSQTTGQTVEERRARRIQGFLDHIVSVVVLENF